MFSPHHKFGGCRALEQLIPTLRDAGAVSGPVWAGYKRYHYALVYKLRSAQHYLDALTATLKPKSPDGPLPPGLGEVMFKANMSIDGFLYCGGSAMDILAREVLTYFAIKLPSDVFFGTARAELAKAHPGDSLLVRLQDPPWKKGFMSYRNAVTHELMIADQLILSVGLAGVQTELGLRLPLPDDPRVDPAQRTTKKHPDAEKYCKQHFRLLLRLVNQVYRDLVPRIRANKGLPL